jgi:hypothetical protein
MAVMSAVAAIAGFALVAGAGTASADASLNLTYTCSFPLIGNQTVPVSITAAVPSSAVVNQPTPAFAVTATVTVPSNATAGLNLVGAKTVAGTATANATVTDGSSIAAPVNLTVPTTNVPASGTFNVVSSGNAPSETLTQTGTATITVGSFSTTLTPRNANGQPTGLGTFTSNCTLNAGQSNTLATFPVTAN